MSFTTKVLAAGAAIRLTRFVTTDSLGERLIHEPIDLALMRWWEEHYAAEDLPIDPEDGSRLDLTDYRWPRAFWYRTGLDCPFCVGFWISLAAVASEELWGGRRVWRVLAGALTLNYVTAHLSKRLDTIEPTA